MNPVVHKLTNKFVQFFHEMEKRKTREKVIPVQWKFWTVKPRFLRISISSFFYLCINFSPASHHIVCLLWWCSVWRSTREFIIHHQKTTMSDLSCRTLEKQTPALTHTFDWFNIFLTKFLCHYCSVSWGRGGVEL